MKRPDLNKVSLEQLVANFKEWSYKQAGSIGDNSNDYTKAYTHLMAIGDELKRRGPDARRALLPLLNCTGDEAGPWKALSAGAQCRYNAAWQLLTAEPDAALAALEKLGRDKITYAGFLARITLGRLQDGSFKPT